MSALRRAPVLRTPEPRELDRVAALFTALLEHHATGDGRFAPAEGVPGLRAWLGKALEEPDQALRVAALADGNLAGFCLAVVTIRPGFFAETRRGEVAHLFVRPDQRRHGVGRALASDAFSWLRSRGVGRVAIQVARENAEGRAFWQGLGFAPAMDVMECAL